MKKVILIMLSLSLLSISNIGYANCSPWIWDKNFCGKNIPKKVEKEAKKAVKVIKDSVNPSSSSKNSKQDKKKYIEEALETLKYAQHCKSSKQCTAARVIVITAISAEIATTFGIGVPAGIKAITDYADKLTMDQQFEYLNGQFTAEELESATLTETETVEALAYDTATLSEVGTMAETE